MIAARHRSHGREARKHQTRKLRASRRPPRGACELGNEVHGQRELGEGLDVHEGLEPGVVVVVGEEGVCGEGDVGGAEGEEEVEGGGGGLVEGFGVEGDEVEGW